MLPLQYSHVPNFFQVVGSGEGNFHDRDQSAPESPNRDHYESSDSYPSQYDKYRNNWRCKGQNYG